MSNSILDKRWPWLVAALAIIGLYVVTMNPDAGDGTSIADPRRLGSIDDITALAEREDLNVLFILIDTLRSDHLGSYGYERDTSPFLDELAENGILFKRHLSQSSWTKASMASMWTGINPWRTGVTSFDHIVPESAEMPAETLKDAGYRTAGIWRNGWVAPTFGFEQGFDVYNRPRPLGLRNEVLAKKPTLKGGGTDEDIAASMIEFLRVQNDEKWFLYLHMMDVHEYTYDDTSALFGSEYMDIYDNSIRWVDDTIRIMFEHLIDQGFSDNTIVVVTSDHGEAFNERGFDGHGRRVYKETTEVPLIVSLPFKLEQSLVVETRSRGIDVWPTVFELLGLSGPEDIDGRSLIPDVMAAGRGEAPPEADRIGYSHLDQNWGLREAESQQTVAVSDGPLRYVRSFIGGQAIEDLFDASTDDAELQTLTATETETLDRLRALIDGKLEQDLAFGEHETREIGELELNQLRAIGYDVGGK